MKYILFGINVIWSLKWLYIKAYVFLYLLGLLAKSTLTYTDLAIRVALMSLIILTIGIGLNYENIKLVWKIKNQNNLNNK